MYVYSIFVKNLTSPSIILNLVGYPVPSRLLNESDLISKSIKWVRILTRKTVNFGHLIHKPVGSCVQSILVSTEVYVKCNN